jgi:hypothetical protein
LGGIMVDFAREWDVELDDVRGQAEDMPEAREARPGVVDREADPPCPEACERHHERSVIVDLRVLGDFDDQASRVDVGEEVTESVATIASGDRLIAR